MKYPLHIIIDGPDNTGKSTICQLLSKRLHIPTVKMPNMKEYIEKGSTEEFSKLFNETLIQFKQYDFILDRGFTSSLAYSLVHNRPFDLSYIDKIEEELEPEVFILTGLTPNLNFEYFDLDEIYTKEQTVEVDKAFTNLATDREYDIIPVYGKTPDEIVENILALLTQETR